MRGSQLCEDGNGEFQTEETVSEKVLRLEGVWCVGASEKNICVTTPRINMGKTLTQKHYALES